MNAKARLYFVHARSPLHAGTGQGVGVIDLPIAREKATGIPYLPGSSIKGVLRDLCARDEKQKSNLIPVFGPDGANASDHASSIVLGDAHLLLLPVRSLAGTFAWVTSPYLLQRMQRAADDVGDQNAPQKIPSPTWDNQTINCVITEQSILRLDGKVLLEDLDLTTSVAPDDKKHASEWALWIAGHLWAKGSDWKSELQRRFCIVPDDVFTFLLENATEVIARIAMESERKTVKQGGLWYEEALPTESVLVGLSLATEVKAKPQVVFDTLEALSASTIQLGGKATVGRGLCRVHFKVPAAN